MYFWRVDLTSSTHYNTYMAIHLDSDEQRLPGMASSNSRNEINAAKEKEPMLVAFRGGWQAKVVNYVVEKQY